MFVVIKELLEEVNCKIRFYVHYTSELELTDWVKGFMFPVEGYVEAPTFGLLVLRSICWVEIHSIEERDQGRLLPVRQINHKEFIEGFHSLEYTVCNSIIKIRNTEYTV